MRVQTPSNLLRLLLAGNEHLGSVEDPYGSENVFVRPPVKVAPEAIGVDPVGLAGDEVDRSKGVLAVAETSEIEGVLTCCQFTQLAGERFVHQHALSRAVKVHGDSGRGKVSDADTERCGPVRLEGAVIDDVSRVERQELAGDVSPFHPVELERNKGRCPTSKFDPEVPQKVDPLKRRQGTVFVSEADGVFPRIEVRKRNSVDILIDPPPILRSCDRHSI